MTLLSAVTLIVHSNHYENHQRNSYKRLAHLKYLTRKVQPRQITMLTCLKADEEPPHQATPGKRSANQNQVKQSLINNMGLGEKGDSMRGLNRGGLVR